MTRHDLLLILAGAGAVTLLLTAFGFGRALILRRRRKRQAAEAWREAVPQAEHPAIGEIRREADDAHRRYLRERKSTEERQATESDWIRDGEIILAPKKPPEETP